MDFLCTVDANHRQRSFRKAALRNSLENAENLSVEKGALLRPVSEKLSYFNRLNDVGKNKITRCRWGVRVRPLFFIFGLVNLASEVGKICRLGTWGEHG